MSWILFAFGFRFDFNMSVLQGVMEAIRISCAGYPTRKPFYEFVDRFGILAPEVLSGRFVIEFELAFIFLQNHKLSWLIFV